MKEAELERLLVKHFRLERELEASSGLAWRVNTLPRILPPQSARFAGVVPALLDWKLDFAWLRLGFLAGCALTGVVVGVFGPAPENWSQPHGTAIAYAMPPSDFPADRE
jgi:hypothetical protein